VSQGEAYLRLVTDAYSRKIVGYHVHQHLNAALVRVALEMADQKPAQSLIHHSERGSQYCAEHYQQLHRMATIAIRMP